MIDYSVYKRDVLRGMLECRGGIPGSKSRDVMIEELQRLDQGPGPVALPDDDIPESVPAEPAGSELQWMVRERAALYGEAPSETVMQNLIREVCLEIERDKEREERKQEREHALWLIEVRGQRDSGSRSDPSTSMTEWVLSACGCAPICVPPLCVPPARLPSGTAPGVSSGLE